MLRVDEHYVSIQGEGPRVGVPTQFIRFGGCNLRCPGWPCDTQHAIDPAFRNTWVRSNYTDIIAKAFNLRTDTGASNICLTGGEPFLQPKDDLELLFRNLVRAGFYVECFSNGTLPYPDWALDIKFVMDWKLAGSGESEVNRATRWTNLQRLNKWNGIHQAVKFVLKDEDDLDEAYTIWDSAALEGLSNLQFYYGRVWDAAWTDADMIAAVLKRKLPWKLNIQIHNYVWDRNLRGI